MRRKLALVAALVVAAGTLTACGESNPPCETLPKPTAVEQQAAREGAEVEREVNGAECVVVGDRWTDQTDD